MGELGTVVVVAAILSCAYYLYAQRALGQRVATALALLVFFLLFVLLVCYRVV